MSKLYFRYGAMNSGKSTNLMQVAHNYEERGMKVLLIKPSTDKKGGDKLVSRLGVERKVDLLINDEQNVYEEVNLELTGEYLDIAFNSRYFLEGLKNIDSEEIFIEFTTNINPCIIRPADDVKYTYLLLPVRISSNI